MVKKIYIYGLSGDDGEIRYVGQSVRPHIRKYEHIGDKRTNKHKSNWIKKLINNGESLNVTILEECNEENWVEREKFWISEFNNLTNLTLGGEGSSGIKYNTPYSEVKNWVNVNLPNIKTETDWRKYTKENTLPDFIPKRPDWVYKNRGWLTFPNFFDKNYERVNFINFNELKKLIFLNNISSISEYRILSNENKILKIPYNPTIIYSDLCESWSNLLCEKKLKINLKKEIKKRFIIDFDLSKEIIKKYNFTKKIDYLNFVKNNIELNLCLNPKEKYKEKWISWGDFFGNNNPKNIIYKGKIKKTCFLSYDDAKKWVNDNHPNIFIEKQWRVITKELPIFIPKRPDYIYKNNGWVSYKKFLLSDTHPTIS